MARVLSGTMCEQPMSIQYIFGHGIKLTALSAPTGNKLDMEEYREVQLAEAETLAKHYDIISAFETSAKDSSNVEEAFVKMASELMMRHGGPVFSEKSTDSIKLDSKDMAGDSWNCAC